MVSELEMSLIIAAVYVILCRLKGEEMYSIVTTFGFLFVRVCPIGGLGWLSKAAGVFRAFLPAQFQLGVLVLCVLVFFCLCSSSSKAGEQKKTSKKKQPLKRVSILGRSQGLVVIKTQLALSMFISAPLKRCVSVALSSLCLLFSSQTIQGQRVGNWKASPELSLAQQSVWSTHSLSLCSVDGISEFSPNK